jgi:hypothetical protein
MVIQTPYGDILVSIRNDTLFEKRHGYSFEAPLLNLLT